MDYADIARLETRRVVLTHIHSNMLEHAVDVAEACAYDGYTLTL